MKSLQIWTGRIYFVLSPEGLSVASFMLGLTEPLGRRTGKRFGTFCSVIEQDGREGLRLG